MKTVKEKSVGCIILKDDKVLLVYEDKRYFWGFPKGHMEEGEDEIQTAKRETKEEVGLEVEIDESKRYVLNYLIRKPDKNVDKTTVLYLAKPITNNIIMQEGEIKSIKWATFDEALKTLTYDDWKEALRKLIKDLKGE